MSPLQQRLAPRSKPRYWPTSNVVTWAEIVLLILKIVNAIMGEVGNQRQFQAGADAEIAKITAAILRKTEAGRKIMERVDEMSPGEVDDTLRGLEPK